MTRSVPIKYAKGTNNIYLPYSPAKWIGKPKIEPCLVIHYKDSGSLADPSKLIFKWKKMESIKSNALETFTDIITNEKITINTNLIVKIVERNFVSLKLISENKSFGIGEQKMYICINKKQSQVNCINRYKSLDKYTTIL